MEYPYICEYCMKIRGVGCGSWSQNYLDKFHRGNLEDLNRSHKDLNWPYGHKHEVVRREDAGS